MNISEVTKDFESIYGTQSELYKFFSPGRVNLIGEHIDYNFGHVLPFALTTGTYGVVSRRSDKIIAFASSNFDKRVEVSLDNINFNKANDWANYLLGVANEFVKLGYKLNGLNIYIAGDIPNGAGLSSSASIELLMSVILNDLFECGIDQLELAKLSQAAENNFIGVNCGIMDQFSVAMGKCGHALLINCNDLSYEQVPLKINGYDVVIGNTNKRRGLADSKYNERCTECESASEILGTKKLCEISPSKFEEIKKNIKNETILKRATHVIYENERVLKAANYLREGDVLGLGKMMNESHDSLRDLYEVTGFELDTMVDCARNVDGVVGSRMTGAGFGGCTVSVVESSHTQKFISQVGKEYKNITGLEADFYIAKSSDGTRKI